MADSEKKPVDIAAGDKKPAVKKKAAANATKAADAAPVVGESPDAGKTAKQEQNDEAARLANVGEKVAGVKYTPVTNNYTGKLCVNGTDISPGQTGEVPNFDPEHWLMAAWLKQGILSV